MSFLDTRISIVSFKPSRAVTRYTRVALLSPPFSVGIGVSGSHGIMLNDSPVIIVLASAVDEGTSLAYCR